LRDSNRLDEVEVPPGSAHRPVSPRGIGRAHGETMGLAQEFGVTILTAGETGGNGGQRAGQASACLVLILPGANLNQTG